MRSALVLATVVATAVTFAAAATPSRAAIVDHAFEADVSFLIASGLPPAYQGVSNGDRFRVTFSLDTAAPDIEWRTFWGVYPDAIQDVTISVPSRGIFQSLGDAKLEVSNGTTQFQQDGFRIDLPLGGGPTFIFWLRAGGVDGNGPSVLTDDRIPASLDLADWNYTRTMGLYHDAGQGGPGNYTIFTGTPVAAAVPEPASLGVAAVVGGLLAMRRRRH